MTDDIQEIKRKFPRSWSMDYDLETLTVGEDGVPCLVHGSGVKVPVVLDDGFVTLGLPEEAKREIVRCFPTDAERIIREARYSFGHWGFHLHGMYVGVDILRDGSIYIHS